MPDRAVQNGLIDRFGALDDTEGGNTERTNITAIFKKQWQNGWTSADQLYFTKYGFNLFSNFTFYLKDSINGDQINQREKRNIYGYKGSLNKKWKSSNANTEFGYGFRYDDIKDIALNHTIQRHHLDTIQKGKIKEGNVYLYAQHSHQKNKWNFTAGLRLDQLSLAYNNTAVGENKFEKKSQISVNPKLNITYILNKNIQFFTSVGTGFHSNDSRLILEKQVKKVLPRVYSTDLGIVWKPLKNMLIKTTLWSSRSEQEFVYVGDEGIIEAGGRSVRTGIDLSIRYQLYKWLFADVDANFAKPRALDAAKSENYIPLAPVFSSIGGLTLKNKNGLSGSLRYRYLQNRPANETNTLIANGYFITDVLINYQVNKCEFLASVENIFNTAWEEAQFDTESRLRNEASPVSEIHYTPGTPFFFKAGIRVSF